MDENPYRSPEVPPVGPLRRSWAWTALIAITGLMFAYTAFAATLCATMSGTNRSGQTAARFYLVLAGLSFLGLIGSIAFSRRPQRAK